MECEFCDGSGRVDGVPCDDCDGLGYICDTCGEPCTRSYDDDGDRNPDEHDYCDSCEPCYEDELDIDDHYDDDPYP